MPRNDRIKEMKYFNYNYKHAKEDRKKDLIHCLRKKIVARVWETSLRERQNRERKGKKYIWDSMYAS